MEHEIHVVDRPGLRVLTKRLGVTMADLGPTLAQAFTEAYQAIEAARATPAGPPFVIYHQVSEGRQSLDIEICAPVNGMLDAPALWHVGSLPAGTFASLLHIGAYDTVGVAHEALSTWIETHGFIPAGPAREVYLSPPTTPPEQIKTIVEFPVSRVPATVG